MKRVFRPELRDTNLSSRSLEIVRSENLRQRQLLKLNVRIYSYPSILPTLLPSQVFLRESLEHRLEKQREMEVLKAAMIIQAHVMGYMARYDCSELDNNIKRLLKN